MLRRGTWVTGFVLVCLAAAWADEYSIPKEKVDEQKIFYGAPAKFKTPAEVDYQKVVMATPEFGSIKKKKLDSSSGKYWILVSEASTHAVQVIAQVAKETEYDLVVAKGYLDGQQPPIPAKDITALVLAKFEKK